MLNSHRIYFINAQKINESSKKKSAREVQSVYFSFASYLSALNADSVSMYITAPSSPPMLTGSVARTLIVIQN